jgi:hypothetical protein
LFASQIFLVLPPHLQSQRAPLPAHPDAVVADARIHLSAALNLAYEGALKAAKHRISGLAAMGSCFYAVIPNMLVRKLVHHVIVHRGQPLDISGVRCDYRSAVQKGVLNLHPTSTEWQPHAEAITSQAFQEWGAEQIILRVDGIMAFLALPVASAPSESYAKIQGEVLENCVAWYFVQECIRAKRPVPLSELLRPLLATHVTIQAGIGMDGVHDACLPPCLRADSQWFG